MQVSSKRPIWNDPQRVRSFAACTGARSIGVRGSHERQYRSLEVQSRIGTIGGSGALPCDLSHAMRARATSPEPHVKTKTLIGRSLSERYRDQQDLGKNRFTPGGRGSKPGAPFRGKPFLHPVNPVDRPSQGPAKTLLRLQRILRPFRHGLVSILERGFRLQRASNVVLRKTGSGRRFFGCERD